MSFADVYTRRFTEVMAPAVARVTYRGRQLSARRVDLSKRGDSILTEIIDGVSHSAMVLADVSVVGHDSKSGTPYRNGNVMYEVGLALACRQPTEVLLVRDDKDPFLFDVSTVPHMFVDFTNVEAAQVALADEIVARLRQVKLLLDARISLAVATLTTQERTVLAAFSEYGMNQTFWLTQTNLGTLAAMPRLLDKQLIRTAGSTKDGQAMFRWTDLGHALAKSLNVHVPVADVVAEPAAAAPPMPTPSDEPALPPTPATPPPSA